MFSFPQVDPDLGYWDIIAHYVSRGGDFMQSLSSFFFLNIFSGELYIDALFIELCLFSLIIGHTAGRSTI